MDYELYNTFSILEIEILNFGQAANRAEFLYFLLLNNHLLYTVATDLPLRLSYTVEFYKW